MYQIYKIVSDNTDDVYIGRTTTSLIKRFNAHKQSYKKHIATGRLVCSSVHILTKKEA